ncbi:MIP family Ig-specific serine endopeptidase [Mycoplasma bradburyae]|uniref:DUF31 domain-containing protein n=1 Tax=Mycoplasma bradburyae TaxID=2963128 RepID=A0AAW6HRC4_9MOLU|nr:hypothetical protein [Mycoplasma bradburyae]MDC4183326.1 hypothetical protein [Mycoplasma bradburyae]MDC4184134.1 hypothetical protein [Mycoplasma bradburyae]
MAFNKKIIKWPFLLAGLTALSTTVSSCALFDIFNDVYGSGSVNDKTTNKNLSATLPVGDYKKIYDITFSLEFNNSGGYNPSRQKSSPETTGVERSRAYRVFGTGWLFDWQSNPVDENDPNAKWTGYFATNLHVAEALLNPNDNKHYRPSWYGNRQPLSGVDQTLYFNLGKWDEDLAVKNKHDAKTLTYAPLSSLPKTVYTATEFYKESPDWISTIKEETPGIREYIDFAVISITLNLSWEKSADGRKIYKYNDERKLYERWIVKAMDTAKKIWKGNSDFSQPASPNRRNDELTNESVETPEGNYSTGFFDRNDYTSVNSDLSKLNVYLGGYPYYSSWSSTPQYTKYSVDLSNGRKFPVSSDPKGSPGWTINASNTNDISGKNIAIHSDLSVAGGIRGGIYNADIAKNFQLVYRNIKYKQYGYGYIIKDSNLSAGSSGSLALTSNNKALGIYFGTVSVDQNTEANFGLVASLYNPRNITVSVQTKPTQFENDTIRPYDLIYGNEYMKSDYGSYISSVKTLKLPTTRLLAKMVDGNYESDQDTPNNDNDNAANELNSNNLSANDTDAWRNTASKNPDSVKQNQPNNQPVNSKPSIDNNPSRTPDRTNNSNQNPPRTTRPVSGMNGNDKQTSPKPVPSKPNSKPTNEPSSQPNGDSNKPAPEVPSGLPTGSFPGLLNNLPNGIPPGTFPAGVENLNPTDIAALLGLLAGNGKSGSSLSDLSNFFKR